MRKLHEMNSCGGEAQKTFPSPSKRWCEEISPRRRITWRSTMNYESRIRAAEGLPDPVERLLALREIQLELYAGDTYKTDEARRLLGRSELSVDHWGPLTIAIARAEKICSLPPHRSDWRKRSSVENSEPHRLLQDARSYIYSDARFWSGEGHGWNLVAHAISVEITPAQREEAARKKARQVARAAERPARVSEWIKI